ncbi:uncharacterized protein LOC144362069 [Saccoglossus kowalevskii]
MGGVGKCFGVALIALGGLSAVFGIVSIFLCQSDLKYVGAPLWSGIFLMITGAVGLGTGFRPKSNGWLTAFLVLSVLSLVVVACSFVILICGVVYDSYMYNYYDDSYNYYDYPKRQDHLNWPDIPHMFGDYSEGDSYGSSSRWNGEFDDMDDLQDHLNLPNGWNTRPDELQDWLDSLANQDIENLDLPENWEDWYLFLQNWLNEHREEEVEGEDEEETRHGGGGGRHRPIHNGDRDGDNMMEYADDYSYDWGSYDHHVSTALYGVTIILTFIELVVLFAGSVASCCGLCNSTTSNMVSSNRLVEGTAPRDTSQFSMNTSSGVGRHRARGGCRPLEKVRGVGVGAPSYPSLLVHHID